MPPKIIALTPCLHGERVKSFIQPIPCAGNVAKIRRIFRPLEDDRFVEYTRRRGNVVDDAHAQQQVYEYLLP